MLMLLLQQQLPLLDAGGRCVTDMVAPVLLHLDDDGDDDGPTPTPILARSAVFV
jgi:hypothetical protein